MQKLVTKRINEGFMELYGRAKTVPNVQTYLMVVKFIQRLESLNYHTGAMKTTFLSGCLDNNCKVTETPLIAFLEIKFGKIEGQMIQLIEEQAYDFVQELGVDMETDGVKSALKAYIKRADHILKKNIELAKKEQELKAQKVALEKEEKDFIQEMEDIGLQSLHTTEGYTLSVVESYHCNINKNLADQDVVATWLKEHGGEDLVSTVGEIAEKDIQTFKDLGVDVVEKVSMNTTKVKAFVKSGLGITGEQVQFEYKDLPKGLHFFTDKQIKID